MSLSFHVLVISLFVFHGTANNDICPTSSRKYSFLNTAPLTDINRTSLVFSIQACEHARLIFTGNVTNLRPSYEVIIGLLQTTRISRITTCFEFQYTNCIYNSTDTPGILDCNEFRDFWVTLSNGAIAVGKGNTLDEDTLISVQAYKEVEPKFVGINVRSVNESKWRFEKDFEPYIANSLFCTDDVTTTEMPIETTTSADVTATSDDVKPCLCHCSQVTNKWDYLQYLNLTTDELRKELSESLQEIQQSIAIDSEETSRNIAKKTSARDKRQSSATFGVFGTIVISFVPFSFILLDFLRFLRWKKQRRKSN